jgi:hypothetical protein
MEKTSLAYSNTFSATFGKFKFFEFLDERMGELPAVDIGKARDILAKTQQMFVRIKPLTNFGLKKWCAQHLKKEMLALADGIETDSIRSRVNNFVTAKCRDLCRL